MGTSVRMIERHYGRCWTAPGPRSQGRSTPWTPPERPRRIRWASMASDDLLDRYMVLAYRITLLGWVPVVLCLLLFGQNSPDTAIAAALWVGPAISIILGFGLWFGWLLIRAPFGR